MKKWKQVLVIVTVLCFGCLMMAAASQESVYVDAKNLMLSGNYLAAALQFESCAGYGDSVAYGMYCRAMAMAENGNHAAAAEMLKDLDGFNDSAFQAVYCEAYAMAFESGNDSTIIRAGAELFETIPAFRDSLDLAIRAEKLANELDYSAAEAVLAQGDYLDAAAMFDALGDYSNSDARAQDCVSAWFAAGYARAEKLETELKIDEAREVFLVLGDYLDSPDRAARVHLAVPYHDADELDREGKYYEAYEAFAALGDYKDSEARAAECLESYYSEKYDQAAALETAGRFYEAYLAFERLSGYRDSASRSAALYEKAYYQLGCRHLREGDYAAAAECFGLIPAYEDSETKRYLAGSIRFADEMQHYSDSVALYTFDGKYGLINFEKNRMIHPSWTFVEGTDAGTLIVGKNGRYGMVNVSGDVLVKLNWTSYEYMQNAIVFTEENSDGKTVKGIASRDGRVLFGAVWDDVVQIENCYARTECNGKYGIIDLNGTLLTDCLWTAVSDHLIAGDLIIGREYGEGNMLYHLFGTDGTFLTPYPVAQFGLSGNSLTASFEDDRMVFRTAKGEYGFISPDGFVIEPEYEAAMDFSEKRAAVKKDGFWGFIDPKGELVIDNRYLEVSSFEDGFALAVMQDGMKFILSISGRDNYFTDTRYDQARELEAAQDYEKAIRLYESLENYDDSVRRIAACREKFARQLFEEHDFEKAIAQYKLLEGFEEEIAKCEEQIRLRDYSRAIELENEKQYEEALALFHSVGDYSDAPEHIRHITAISAYDLFDAGLYEDAKKGFEQMEGYEDMIAECDRQITILTYDRALALEAEGQYEAAVMEFEKIRDYEDSAEHIRLLNAQYAVALMKNGRYEEARTAFLEEDGNYEEEIRECTYQIGLALREAEEYEAAAAELAKVVGYKDTDTVLAECTEIYSAYLYDLAASYWKNGQKDEALKAYLSIPNYREYQNSKSSVRLLSKRLAYAALDKKYFTDAAAYFSIKRDNTSLSEADQTAIYNAAMEQSKEGNEYNAAILFELIPEYKDSFDRMLKSKYAFVSDHHYSISSNTFRFLKDLKEINYLDSAEIYNELYSWRIDQIAVNTDPDDFETNCETVSTDQPFYCHFRLTGGIPGGVTKLRYAQYGADLSEHACTFRALDGYKRDDRVTFKVDLTGKTMTEGFAKWVIYDYENKEVESFSVNLSEAWRIDQIAVNTDPDDFVTNCETLSMDQPIYCHFRVTGGTPDDAVELRYSQYGAGLPGHAHTTGSIPGTYKRDDRVTFKVDLSGRSVTEDPVKWVVYSMRNVELGSFSVALS